jgi:hypothetical protein
MISSKAPRPTFERPSVQRTTDEPGAPYVAIAMAEAKAGPRAVGPVSSRPMILADRISLVSLIVFCIRLAA